MYFGKSELFGIVEVFTGAGVPKQVYSIVWQKRISFLLPQFDSPIQHGFICKHLFLRTVFIGTVDDVAQSCGKCTVILDFKFIFFAAALVQIFVNERLHRVEVEDVLDNGVFGVRQDLLSEWLLKIIA